MLQLLQITAQPGSEPVTLADVKARLRLTDTADDALITAQMTVAREFVEKILGRSVVGKSYAAFFSKFPWTGKGLLIPMPPTVEVTAVKFLDPTRTWQTWDPSEYQVGVNQEPGVLVEALNFIYPPTAVLHNGLTTVEVDFVAGAFAGPGASTVLECIRQLALWIYANPDATEASYPERTVKILHAFKLYGF